MSELTESPGYKSLLYDVQRDCEGDGGVFNPNGCESRCPNSHCFHQYCDKFKWVIDRVYHYSKTLDIPVENILDSWEKDRNYWYMNFYQNSNQPLINPGRKVKVFETVEDFKESGIEKGFRCPACGGVSTHPTICNSGKRFKDHICDWKSYGLLGTLGKGVFVYIKSEVQGHQIFMPIAWEAKL